MNTKIRDAAKKAFGTMSKMDTAEFNKLIDEYSKKPEVKQLAEFLEFGREFMGQEQPCLHGTCPECNGTGRKKDGTPCVHMLSCPCKKCSPFA